MHPVMGDLKYSTVVMSGDPDSQVEQAIAQMSRYAIADAQTGLIRDDAENATYDAGGDPIKGAFLRARSRIRFTEDRNVVKSPNVVEVLIRPLDVCMISDNLGANSVVGDCDDFSMYVAALLLSQGVPCCFVTVAADPMEPQMYSHVYVAAYPTTGRVAVDASHGKFVGWEAPNTFGKLREWDLFDAAKLRVTQACSVLTFLAIGAFAWWYWNKHGSFTL
jgi:hypothetical protein